VSTSELRIELISSLFIMSCDNICEVTTQRLLIEQNRLIAEQNALLRSQQDILRSLATQQSFSWTTVTVSVLSSILGLVASLLCVLIIRSSLINRILTDARQYIDNSAFSRAYEMISPSYALSVFRREDYQNVEGRDCNSQNA
jgi:hypothetical protein